MKTPWYKTILLQHGRTLLYSAVGSLILSLALLFWYFIFDKHFEWKTIEPIPEPKIFIRFLYSALVYVTLGAFLYWIKFYQLLHNLFIKQLKDKRSYHKLKDLIWRVLMLIMFFWIVPFVVHLLNAILSFFYNIFWLLLYLCPPLGSSLILLSLFHLSRIKSEEKSQQKSIVTPSFKASVRELITYKTNGTDTKTHMEE